ncbi:MAG: DNA starvation/stationary phase protection protein [Planctomycetes bacterium]|nr:DNA starvation/stationary phase protection protein [Planctomycetota bacterium]NOG55157.1 DNA starvation/stationary phase protection protein [Planctomycetota bacterium]
MTPMTTTTQQMPAAPVQGADTVAGRLQAALVELVDLSLIGKQAHWNLTGPNFASLHVKLDEMVDEYRAWGDEVAERMLALGVPADGRAATVTESSPAAGFREGLIADTEVLEWFASNLRETAGRFREHIAGVSDNDPISEDLLIGIVQGIEMQQWMIRSQIG